MADHIITLTVKQENALAVLVTERQDQDPSATADSLLKRYCLLPIKAKIDELDVEKVAPIVVALPNATNDQLNQIKVILGI